MHRNGEGLVEHEIFSIQVVRTPLSLRFFPLYTAYRVSCHLHEYFPGLINLDDSYHMQYFHGMSQYFESHNHRRAVHRIRYRCIHCAPVLPADRLPNKSTPTAW